MGRFVLSNAMAWHEHSCEFQFGRTLVWVMASPLGGVDLDRAERMFDEVWGAIPSVLAAAERASRAQVPGFWEDHDGAGAAGDPLAVWGIWIGESVEYEVGENFDLIRPGPTQPPEFPDDSSIMVSRSPDGTLRVLG